MGLVGHPGKSVQQIRENCGLAISTASLSVFSATSQVQLLVRSVSYEVIKTAFAVYRDVSMLLAYSHNTKFFVNGSEILAKLIVGIHTWTCPIPKACRLNPMPARATTTFVGLLEGIGTELKRSGPHGTGAEGRNGFPATPLFSFDLIRIIAGPPLDGHNLFSWSGAEVVTTEA